MNTYLVIFTIVLCVLFLSLRIITILKVRKGDYSSRFVRHLSFFPCRTHQYRLCNGINSFKNHSVSYR